MKILGPYKGFYGSIEKGVEDDCFYGKILDVLDLVLYESGNLKELEKAFQKAVDEYLEDCISAGKEIVHKDEQ
jgi:predicted HicB family RNase H-like nuclease